MDIAIAIERHRKPLLRIVATLFAMLGLTDNAPVEKVAKPVYLAVLRLLRPAESAARRLIVAAASGLVVKPLTARSAPGKPEVSRRLKAPRQRPPAFQLFDPLQRISAFPPYRRGPFPVPLDRQRPRPEPRVRLLDAAFDPRVPAFLRSASPPPPPPPPEPDDSISAMRLSRRLIALKAALENLPRQALRYARWQARPSATRRPQRTSALRPGRPPGHRKTPRHKVDRMLDQCHWLAKQAAHADTS